jgi:hypothetical protein
MAYNMRPDPVTHKLPSNINIHKLAKIPTIKQFFQKLTIKLTDNLKNHFNTVITDISNAIPSINNNVKNNPFKIINECLTDNSF